MSKQKQMRRHVDSKLKRQQDRKQIHRNVKDRLFRFLFEKDREALLELYNALNRTSYTDPSQLEIVTIESAVYLVMKNDLAYILSGTLNLYEHQSTYSSNLPVRFLIYLAQEYQVLVERTGKSLYGSGRIGLPTPQCVVFYNGMKEMPEEMTLKLSDAFENKRVQADVELTVRIININHGHNKLLMEKCRVLEEYSKMAAVTRKYMDVEADLQTALNRAMDYCIKNGILTEFLLKNRTEVLGMLLEEFDVEKYERTIREEEIEKINRLGIMLIEAGRSNDFINSLSDRKLQEDLLVEFGLEAKEWNCDIILDP